MGETVRHPVIVDTDALIAVANTQLWSEIISTLKLTTTNVCIQELKRHVQENAEFAQLRSRQRKLHEGSKAGLEPFEDNSNTAFTVTTSVPRPHGADTGEICSSRDIPAFRSLSICDPHGQRGPKINQPRF